MFLCLGLVKNGQSWRSMIGQGVRMVINGGELSEAYLFRFFSVSVSSEKRIFLSSGYREGTSYMRVL